MTTKSESNAKVEAILRDLGLVKKQHFGIEDQLGLVLNRLEEVAALEAEAPAASESNPWSKMPATKIGRSLATARLLLEEARDILQAEFDCYSGWQKEIDAIKDGSDDDTRKIAALTAILEPARSREPETAGLAAYCMESVRAVQTYIVAAMEKSRSYRSKA
ncbi:MAG: hypothetical protein AB7W16_21135 [Candidatus Obscuribacterales bacterium]